MIKHLKNVAEIRSVDDILSQFGATRDDVTKIYYGKDHACRCGCKGTYHRKGTASFTKMLNRISKDAAGLMIRWFEAEGEIGPGRKPLWVNLPVGDRLKDMCYCIDLFDC